MKEIELKFFNINKEEIIKKLKELGANIVYEGIIESLTFENDKLSGVCSKKDYLRLRKCNNKSFLTYKSPCDCNNECCREETEIIVDSFEKTKKILENIGLKGFTDKRYRTHYELREIHFEIDTYEGLEPFLEIEAQTQEELERACKLLDLDISQGKCGLFAEIFPEKFKKIINTSS